MADLAIITGASRGIGRAAADVFLANGSTVINLSRSPCVLADVRSIAVDLSDVAAVQALQAPLKSALHTADRIFLIHNAAHLESDTIGDVNVEVFAKVLAVNLLAPVALNQITLPFMGAGSAILYVGSTLSEKAIPGGCSYVTSKHALVGLMRSTCQDLAGTGIHTACVCPGFTDTEMLRTRAGDDTATLENFRQMSTMGRLIAPKEIAELLYFAAHHPVINGAVLHANLGQIER